MKKQIQSREILKWKDDSGKESVLKVDVVMSFREEATATPTTHAIETGGQISDHVHQGPTTIALEIFQTETPIELSEADGWDWKTSTLDVPKSAFKPGGLLAVTSAVGNAIGKILGGDKPTKTITLRAKKEEQRVRDLRDTLIRIKQNAWPITFTFRGQTYPNFLITRLSHTYAANRIGAGEFVLEATSFQTVSTQTATLPDPVDLHLKDGADKGKQPSAKEEKDKVKAKSLLQEGLNSLLE
jgi:hypothetical protein